MPMKSEAQRRKLWAAYPEVAKEFEAATPKGKKLPEKVTTKPPTKGAKSGVAKRRK
jgi:hypothetical protein